MSDISIQFHATPDELLLLVQDFVQDARIFVSAIKYEPFKVIPVENQALVLVLHQTDVERLAFTIKRPVLRGNGMMGFLDRNPSALLLDIGRRVDAGLQESGITARTSDKAVLGIWRKLSRRIIAATRTGVTAVNPQTGATAPVRSHRFSDGAKALERAGVPMLPVAGTARLRFED